MPSHSAVLSQAHVAAGTAQATSVDLAAGTAGAFVMTGLGVALGAPWATATAVIASLMGLTLKLLYLHPWLTIGVLLDALCCRPR